MLGANAEDRWPRPCENFGRKSLLFISLAANTVALGSGHLLHAAVLLSPMGSERPAGVPRATELLLAIGEGRYCIKESPL